MENEEPKNIIDRRKPEPDMLKVILDSLNDHKFWVDDELHSQHHEFIKILLEREHRRLDRWDRIREQVTGWALIAILGGIGTAVYTWIINLKDHAK